MGASYVRDLSVSSLITTTTGTARLTWGGGAELSEGDDLMVCMCVCVEEVEVVTSVVSSALLYLWTQLLRNADSSSLSCPPAQRCMSAAAAWTSTGVSAGGSMRH